MFHTNIFILVSFFWRDSPQWARAFSLMRFRDHIQRRTTFDKTPLDEWSTRQRDLYLTTHNAHNRQISMPPVGFEPTISAGDRTQTYTLDCADPGTDLYLPLLRINLPRQVDGTYWCTGGQQPRIKNTLRLISDTIYVDIKGTTA